MNNPLATMASFALTILSLTCAPPPKLLRDFRVICVSPTTPGNVGMIARAIANFEAGGLTLVAPGYDREFARWRATSGARRSCTARRVSLPSERGGLATARG